MSGVGAGFFGSTGFVVAVGVAVVALDVVVLAAETVLKLGLVALVVVAVIGTCDGLLWPSVV